MAKTHRLSHTLELYNNFRILKIPEINILQTCVFMFKIHHNLLSYRFTGDIMPVSNVHSHFTRSADNYFVRTVNTNIGKFGIKYRGPHIWNTLPSHVCTIDSINLFKNLLLVYYF